MSISDKLLIFVVVVLVSMLVCRGRRVFGRVVIIKGKIDAPQSNTHRNEN
jgi:hypothetical protein